MECVDLLIINNCPNFYKINLYNELAKRCKIYVIFLAVTDQAVNNKEYKKDIEFPYRIIEEIQIEKRSKLKCFFKLCQLCKKINYKKIILGGYAMNEFFFLAFLLPKRKKILQFESTIKESVVSGAKGLIKRCLFSGFYVALPSGELHSQIFQALNYKGTVIKTLGVGIFNRQERFIIDKTVTKEHYKYIFVGRLIQVKNLKNLVMEFNHNGYDLSIVGTGPQESELKEIAKDNIHFLGFISNNELGSIYQQHDIFILPSYSETWGLVVEEAIYWGLPVIVSDAVGCQEEMVIKPNTGIVYNLDNDKGLHTAIQSMCHNYSYYKSNVLNFDFERRDQEQVDAYIKSLNL